VSEIFVERHRLPAGHIPTALLFFSLGVESGHFMFHRRGAITLVRRINGYRYKKRRGLCRCHEVGVGPERSPTSIRDRRNELELPNTSSRHDQAEPDRKSAAASVRV